MCVGRRRERGRSNWQRGIGRYIKHVRATSALAPEPKLKGKSGGNVDALSGVSLSVSFFFVRVPPPLLHKFPSTTTPSSSFVVVLLFFEKKKRWVGERSALTQAKQRAPPPAPCVCAPRYSYTDQWQSGNGGVSSALSRLDASHLSPLTRALFSSLPLFSFFFFHPLLILLLFFPTSPTIFFLFWPFPPFDVVRSCPRSQRACRSPAFLLALSLPVQQRRPCRRRLWWRHHHM